MEVGEKRCDYISDMKSQMNDKFVKKDKLFFDVDDIFIAGYDIGSEPIMLGQSMSGEGSLATGLH